MSAGRDTGRIEAFSDGVFAIAITLLVIEIGVPHLEDEPAGTTLFGALVEQWPSFAFVNVTASLVLIVVLALLFVLPEPGERRMTPKRDRRGIR
jgi:Endosomal/lysosomal potassium channel TMEM175